MSEVWRERFVVPSAAEIDKLARETHWMLPYQTQGLTALGVREDFIETWRRYIEIYFQMLAEQRLPTDDEIAELEKIARRRLHQSIELVDLQRAFRSGTRILLDIALERVNPTDAGAVASSTLKFADIMATAAERAYLDEQHSFAAARTDLTVATLLRLLRGEISPDDPSLDIEPDHGFDFNRPYTVVEISCSRGAVRRHRSAESSSRRLGNSLRGILPFALRLALSEDDITVIIIPGDSISGLRRLLTDFLANSPDFHELRVGIANPRVGLRSFLAAYEESARARALGEVLFPARRVHLWEELEKIDIFAHGESINMFINSTIGPLIEHDRRRGTQLIETLAAFFENNGNRKAAANSLHIHINTLDYRLRQVRSMIADESMMANSFVLHLAIRLYPLYQRLSHGKKKTPERASRKGEYQLFGNKRTA